MIVRLENPDALVSYADPNAGHKGGVYRAASWLYHGKSEEVRTYRAPDGTTVARRAFHSGRNGLRKAEIEALGYKEEKLPGKERFVRPLSKRAARTLTANLSFKAMIEEQLTDSEKLKQQICDEILRKLKLQVDRVMRSSSSESEAN